MGSPLSQLSPEVLRRGKDLQGYYACILFGKNAQDTSHFFPLKGGTDEAAGRGCHIVVPQSLSSVTWMKGAARVGEVGERRPLFKMKDD